MITSSRGENDFQAKEEGETNDAKFSKPPSSSRQWSAFRNPRIVRVSRSFGGKDRHSKVCTIRGLRDRRIRLSVPTAIQLYDLQDRLGLNQPSKVIDWLLDACKDDIDKLPPLQVPQGFCQFQSPMFLSHESNASQSTHLSPFFDANSTLIKDGGGFHSLGVKINSGIDGEDHNMLTRSKYWEVEASLRGKSKEIENVNDKGKWVRTNEEENNQHGVSNYGSQIYAQNLFPLTTTHSSLPSFLNNAMPYNPYYHLDASNLSLAQMGTHGFLSQNDQNSLTNNNGIPLPPSLALASGSQLLFCPPQSTLPTLFPPYPPYVTSAMGSDSHEINHFQLQSSSNTQQILQNPRETSYPVKPFSLNVSSGLVHDGDNEDS